MLAEPGEAARPRPNAEVAVIVALEAERRCLDPIAHTLSIRRCGPGEARAAAAAEEAVAAGARALVSFGLAGGIAADAAPGRLLLPRSIVTADGRRFDVHAAWRARLAASMSSELDIDDRPLLAAADVLETHEAKAHAAGLGVVGVDMESGAIAAAAARAGVPFVVVRAVADGPRDALPPGVATWVDAHGKPLARPIAGAALKPSNWHALWTLAKRYRAARRTLERAARELADRSFLLE
jgi:adenosylhomocysteine nucleosidase